MSSYRLRKWAKACRLRDGNTCQMCERIGGPIEVHHCKPKASHPEQAYDLDNGVSLCFCCHRAVVHAGNSFDLTSCTKWWPLWHRYMGLAAIKRFNQKYQNRI